MSIKQTAYIAATSAFTPLGNSTHENWLQIKDDRIALQAINVDTFGGNTWFAGKFNKEQASLIDQWMQQLNCSKFEAICHIVIDQLLQQTKLNPSSSNVLCIIATTKGNIDQIANKDDLISNSLLAIQEYWKFTHKIVGISNACISGSLGIIMAQRYIEQGKFEHVLVIGADILDNFVVKGFQSFQAISKSLCRPFDAQRDGINLGEAAAGVLLTTDVQSIQEPIVSYISGGGITNDANHLSGPSRTGAELGIAIKNAMSEANITSSDIGCIAAHGTGTIFNDEMESKAIAINNLNNTPLYSLKSFYGHTLGASGVLECVIALQAMKDSCIIPNLRFENTDVSGSIKVASTWINSYYNHFLKTASGFGGCNAAFIISKKA